MTSNLGIQEETLYLHPTDPATISELVDVQAGQEEALELLSEIAGNIVILSEIIEDGLPGHKISIQNFVNTELTLLTISDGEVLYNFVDD